MVGTTLKMITLLSVSESILEIFLFFLFNYRDNIEFEQRFPDMFQSQYQVCLRYSVTNTQKFGKF